MMLISECRFCFKGKQICLYTAADSCAISLARSIYRQGQLSRKQI